MLHTTRKPRLLASVVLWAALLVGVAVPFVMGVVSVLTPDSIVRASSAGTFVSAATRGGGFLSSSTTMVRTTTGTIAVHKPLSALRCQRLIVVDRLRSGLQLCAEPGVTPCVPVVGRWAGPMHAVPYARHATDWVARHIALNTLIFWFCLGCLDTLVVLLFMHEAGHQDDDDRGHTPDDSPNAMRPDTTSDA